MSNLVSNALKYSKRGSKISIHANTTDNQAVLNVIDKGEGIPEDLLAVLFNENESTNRVGNEGEVGTGFGMLQVKIYVEQFGGKIDVMSKIGEDSGTTFTLTIPLAQDPVVGSRKLA